MNYIERDHYLEMLDDAKNADVIKVLTGELLRRYKWVRIGKVDNLEIDFVACTFSGDIEYFQVAYTVRDESTLKHELEPFRKVKDFNRRTLITQDVDPVASYDGIMKINAIDWLLAKG